MDKFNFYFLCFIFICSISANAQPPNLDNIIRREATYKETNNKLEKSLIVGFSTPEDFQDVRDDGGLNVHNKWHDYQVLSAEVVYTKDKLSLFKIVVDQDYKKNSPKPTINMLKFLLQINDGCTRTSWKLINSDVSGYISINEYLKCEISEAKNGGYSILVQQIKFD